MPSGAIDNLQSSGNYTALPHYASDTYQGVSQRALRPIKIASVEPPVVFVVTRLLNPFLAVTALWFCIAVFKQQPSMPYLNLSALAFVLSIWVLQEPDLNPRLRSWISFSSLRNVLGKWCLVMALLLLVAFATKTSEIYSRKVIMSWFLLTPVLLLMADAMAWRIACRMASAGIIRRTHIIVGATPVGIELAHRITHNACMGAFIGYFDDDNSSRQFNEPKATHGNVSGNGSGTRILGSITDVPDYVRRNAISAVHIATATVAQPHIQQIINELRDTTASIYFVPDISCCDLMQARIVSMDGLPLVAIRETPFCGIDGVVKRCTDIAFALLILALIWPVLLAIGVAIKMSSAGPALFKQRRYGLDGEEFWVYKFRTMTVCEDGEQVVQATRFDSRVTALGKILRKLSLDELPQIFNVLGGSMSLVGPRPHAVAHNEQYRKLIQGYMLRHKARPGITGWAQVNGLRGETDTVDKMEKRVVYDLEYLRNWSVWLDIVIVFRTALMIFHDKRAY